MKTVKRIASSLCLFAVSGLIGCASPHHVNISRLKLGMEKDQVLELVGNPNHTNYSKGLRTWVYVYYQNNNKLGKKLIFKKEHLIKISEHSFKPSLKDQLNESESFKDYENKVKKRRSKAKEGFKDVSSD